MARFQPNKPKSADNPYGGSGGATSSGIAQDRLKYGSPILAQSQGLQPGQGLTPTTTEVVVTPQGEAKIKEIANITPATPFSQTPQGVLAWKAYQSDSQKLSAQTGSYSPPNIQVYSSRQQEVQAGESKQSATSFLLTASGQTLQKDIDSFNQKYGGKELSGSQYFEAQREAQVLQTRVDKYNTFAERIQTQEQPVTIRTSDYLEKTIQQNKKDQTTTTTISQPKPFQTYYTQPEKLLSQTSKSPITIITKSIQEEVSQAKKETGQDILGLAIQTARGGQEGLSSFGGTLAKDLGLYGGYVDIQFNKFLYRDKLTDNTYPIQKYYEVRTEETRLKTIEELGRIGANIAPYFVGFGEILAPLTIGKLGLTLRFAPVALTKTGVDVLASPTQESAINNALFGFGFSVGLPVLGKLTEALPYKVNQLLKGEQALAKLVQTDVKFMSSEAQLAYNLGRISEYAVPLSLGGTTVISLGETIPTLIESDVYSRRLIERELFGGFGGAYLGSLGGESIGRELGKSFTPFLVREKILQGASSKGQLTSEERVIALKALELAYSRKGLPSEMTTLEGYKVGEFKIGNLELLNTEYQGFSFKDITKKQRSKITETIEETIQKYATSNQAVKVIGSSSIPPQIGGKTFKQFGDIDIGRSTVNLAEAITKNINELGYKNLRATTKVRDTEVFGGKSFIELQVPKIVEGKKVFTRVGSELFKGGEAPEFINITLDLKATRRQLNIYGEPFQSAEGAFRPTTYKGKPSKVEVFNIKSQLRAKIEGYYFGGREKDLVDITGIIENTKKYLVANKEKIVTPKLNRSEQEFISDTTSNGFTLIKPTNISYAKPSKIPLGYNPFNQEQISKDYYKNNITKQEKYLVAEYKKSNYLNIGGYQSYSISGNYSNIISPKYVPDYLPKYVPPYVPEYNPPYIPPYNPPYTPIYTPKYTPPYVPKYTPPYVPPYTPPYTPPTKIYTRRYDFGSEGNKKKRKGYIALQRKKGKFVPITGEILPEQKAYQQAANKTLNDLTRSISVKQVGFTEQEDIMKANLSSFRFKKPKSKIMGEPVFVQKTESLLQTKGEKDEIKKARQRMGF